METIFIAQTELLQPNFIPRLIEQFGLTAVALFIAVLFLLSLFGRRMSAQAKKINAQTQAQEVLNSQFVLVQKENLELQDRIDKLQELFHAMRSDFAVANQDRISLSLALDEAERNMTSVKNSADLATKQIGTLKDQIAELSRQVEQLEREKQHNATELKTEKARADVLQEQNKALRVEIDQLKQRMASVEGENGALIKVLDTLKVLTGELEAVNGEARLPELIAAMPVPGELHRNIAVVPKQNEPPTS